MHSEKPRVLHLHPIVPAHWGTGHSDRFKQRASEWDNRKLCIWRVKYAWEAKVDRGWWWGGYHHCVTLFPTPNIQAHTHTLCPPVTDGWMLAKVNSELPLLSSITLTVEDSWEADIPSSQLSEENKRVCGTPPTSTCMCSDTHTHTP